MSWLSDLFRDDKIINYIYFFSTSFLYYEHCDWRYSRICVNMQFKLTASEWSRGKHVYLMQVDDGMSRCPKRLCAD